jgi:hypothetical protein
MVGYSQWMKVAARHDGTSTEYLRLAQGIGREAPAIDSSPCRPTGWRHFDDRGNQMTTATTPPCANLLEPT